MRGLRTGLFGFATVMFVAAWVALTYGKDPPWPCIALGVISGALGCLVWRSELQAKLKR